MRKIVDLKKQSKKAQKAFHATQRGSWNGINPVSRVVPSGKAYSRAKAKAEARKDACRPFFCPFSWELQRKDHALSPEWSLCPVFSTKRK